MLLVHCNPDTTFRQPMSQSSQGCCLCSDPLQSSVRPQWPVMRYAFSFLYGACPLHPCILPAQAASTGCKRSTQLLDLRGLRSVFSLPDLCALRSSTYAQCVARWSHLTASCSARGA